MALWKKKDIEALFAPEGFLPNYGTCGLDDCTGTTFLLWLGKTGLNGIEYYELNMRCTVCERDQPEGHPYPETLLTKDEAIGVSSMFLAQRGEEPLEGWWIEGTSESYEGTD